MTDWYFAYGSNMNPARMAARGMAFSEAVAGQLPGFALRFNKKATGKSRVAYANIVYAPKSCVEGVLYRLNTAADITVMDPYEGNPVRYSRDVFPVYNARRVINAWVYVANPALIADDLLPEKRYLQHLLAGRQWHSEQYHQWLINHPSAESEIAANGRDDGKNELAFNV